MLPFKYTGSNADLTALADGLFADIVTGLSRFSCLRVIARSSTLRFANELPLQLVRGDLLGHAPRSRRLGTPPLAPSCPAFGRVMSSPALRQPSIMDSTYPGSHHFSISALAEFRWDAM
jgi:hypothetical protein